MRSKLKYIFFLFAAVLLCCVNSRAHTKELTSAEIASAEKQLSEDSDNVGLLKDIGMYYFRNDDFSTSDKYAHRLLDLGIKNNTEAEIWGRFLLAAGNVFSHSVDDVALINLEIAKNLAERDKNIDALISIYNCLGVYHLFYNNDPFSGSNYYYMALETAREHGNHYKESSILSNLAAAYIIMDDPSGLMLAEQSVELAKKNDPEHTVNPRLILAESYVLADSIIKAENTLDLIRKEIPAEIVASAKGNIDAIEVKINLKKGNFNEAARILEEFEYDDQNMDPSMMSSLALMYSMALKGMGRGNESIPVLESALANAIKSNVKIHTPKLMEQLTEMYRDAGMTKKALEMSISAKNYSDSVYTVSHQRNLHENRIRHEVYTRQREIDDQRMQLSSKNNKLILLSVSLVIISALLIVLFYYHRRREKLYRAIVVGNTEHIAREKELTAEIDSLRKSKNKPGSQETSVNVDTHVESNPESSNAIKETVPESDNKNQELMSSFVSLLETKEIFTDPAITVESAAHLLGTNRTYLSRAINEVSGKTFIKIINEYRIRKALEMISDVKKDYPLKQIASDSGYNSQSTFYTAFQNATGMTPARYRAQLRTITTND